LKIGNAPVWTRAVLEQWEKERPRGRRPRTSKGLQRKLDR
jgi:hypothetical protein